MDTSKCCSHAAKAPKSVSAVNEKVNETQHTFAPSMSPNVPAQHQMPHEQQMSKLIEIRIPKELVDWGQTIGPENDWQAITTTRMPVSCIVDLPQPPPWNVEGGLEYAPGNEKRDVSRRMESEWLRTQIVKGRDGREWQ